MSFSYHRRLAPLVGVVLGLALIEGLVVHLVAMAWGGWRVAVPLGLVDVGLVVLLVWFLASLRRRPILLDGDILTMRTGARLQLSIPLHAIGGFRENWSATDLKQPGLFNMAVTAWPTIVFDLDQPVRRRRREVRAVAHCVDDPEAFRREVARARAAVRALV